MSSVEANHTKTPQKPNPIRATIRLLRFIGFTVTRYTRYRWRFRFLDDKQRLVAAEETACEWMNSCMRLMDVEVIVRGKAPDVPVLLAPNHLGYMDILALGSVTRTFFVSKDEVESWPLLGRIFVGSLQLSVARKDRRAIHKANERIAERLKNGHSVCVFLEGTTSDGSGLLPFHGSLLQSVLDSGMPTVPVGIRWSSIDGSVDIAEYVAYWKDHVFGPHVFKLMGLCGLRATITFGDPIPAEQFSDRKPLTAKVREEVVALRGDAE